MMRRVVEHVVEKIACEQTGKDGRRETAKKQKKKPVEHKREGDAHGGRHDQAAGVVWIVVMHAMEHEVEELAPFGFRFVMNNPAVHRVLVATTDQNAGR